MGEVKYSMKARVKILVNGAAATLLTGAVAAGLILSSTGALQTKNNDVLAARELDETQEEMTREQEPQTEANAELVSAERYQLGMLWEHELTAKKTTEKSTESDEKIQKMRNVHQVHHLHRVHWQAIFQIRHL